MNKITFRVALYGVVIMLLLAGCSKAQPSVEKELKIGLPVTTSGLYATWEIPFKTGKQIAIDEVNTEGGLMVGGQRYKVVPLWVECKPDPAESRAVGEKLIYSDKVKIINVAGDPKDSAIDPVSTKEKVVLLTETSVPDVLTAPDHPYNFGTFTFQSSFAQAFWEFFKQQEPQIKKVSAIAVSWRYSVLGNDWMRDGLKKYWPEVVWNQTIYEGGTVDFAPTMTTALATKPDMLLVGTIGGDAAPVIRTAREMGFKGVIAGYPTSAGLELLLKGFKGVEQYLEGMYDIEEEWFPNPPEIVDLKRQFAERGVDWTPSAPRGYMIMTALFKAIQDAGTVEDTDKIVKALENVKVVNKFYPSKPMLDMGGQQTLGQKHLTQHVFALNQIQNGKVVSRLVIKTELP